MRRGLDSEQVTISQHRIQGTVLDFLPLAGYIPASLAIILSPGPDTMLLLRFALKRGARAGLWAMAGILAGLGLIAGVTASGLGVFVASVPWAMTALAATGMLLLVYLAATSIRAAVTIARGHSAGLGGGSTPPSLADRPFVMAFITNVTNPKVLVFFLAFFPQFLGVAPSPLAQMGMLTAVFLLLTILWLTPLSFLAERAQALFRRRRVAIGLDITVAVVFLALAATLITGLDGSFTE